MSDCIEINFKIITHKQMDKYVLVPQEKYDVMMKTRKIATKDNAQSNKKSEGKDSHSIEVPPPGLPASDELAENGIDVSDKEAEEINDRLVNYAYARAKSADVDNTSSETSKKPWKELWRSNTV